MRPRYYKDVFSVGYMRVIRLSLNTIGQWPYRAFGNRSRRVRVLLGYNYMALATSVACALNFMWYAKNNVKKLPFVDAGQVYSNFFLHLLFMQRSTLPLQKKYQSVIKKFVLNFHLIHHEDNNEFSAQEHRRINRICKIASIISLLQLICGILGWDLMPFFINLNAGMFAKVRPENKTFEHCVDYALPFDYKTDTFGYFIVFGFNWIAAYWISSALCFYDLFIFIIVFHISGHLNILIHTIKGFPQPSSAVNRTERVTNEYNEIAFAELKDIIKHYQIIKEFMIEMSEAFDLTLCFYLAFHQIMCCLLLLECSSMELAAMAKYAILTFYVFQQCIEVSVIFELINSKSGSLGDRVYLLPWEQMDVKNRKILLMLLRNVQDPLALKAGGMVPVGVLTMSAIMRTSCSFFLFLKTFDDN
uniref:Odorant receptor n=1 Tax=Grapholita molesta TaxID=192188 RepID=A0A9Y1IQD6_GRAMO|nr:odorant-receptor-6.1 [Grapholita molesta]